MNTSELIADIRKWQDAFETYEADANDDDNMKLRLAANKVIGMYEDSRALRAAFVALADHVEALEARIAAVMALKARPIDIMPNMTAGELYDAGRFVTLRDVNALLADDSK
jgi:hypothetical protein